MNRWFNRRSAGWWLGILLVVGLVVWVVTDLAIPRPHSIRQFDPNSVARIETAIWRSYVNNGRVSLYRQLAGGLRSQFNTPYWRSYGLAFQASRAAFVLKEGNTPADYEAAVPLLLDYYTAVKRLSGESFDPQAMARLDVEAWAMHRNRGRYSYDDLARILAQSAGTLYGLPPARFADYGVLRAQAIRQYDEARRRNPVPKEADWQRMEQQLHWAWQSLSRVLALDRLERAGRVAK